MAIDSTIPRPSQEKVNVVWLDVNTLIDTNSTKPDLLPNTGSINNSLYNLFRCPVGARGPIFQPEYGSSLLRLLHEPLDYITANKIRMYSIQAVQKWEPRINLDLTLTRVDPDISLSGFKVTIAYIVVATKASGNGSFLLSKMA
jgi:phage baseplate assembly protein W